MFEPRSEFGIRPARKNDTHPRGQGFNTLNQQLNDDVTPVFGCFVQAVDDDGQALPVDQARLASACKRLGDEHIPQTAGVFPLHQRRVLDTRHSEQSRTVVRQTCGHLVGQTQHQSPRVARCCTASLAQVHPQHAALGSVGKLTRHRSLAHAGSAFNAKHFAARMVGQPTLIALQQPLSASETRQVVGNIGIKAQGVEHQLELLQFGIARDTTRAFNHFH